MMAYYCVARQSSTRSRWDEDDLQVTVSIQVARGVCRIAQSSSPMWNGHEQTMRNVIGRSRHFGITLMGAMNKTECI